MFECVCVSPFLFLLSLFKSLTLSCCFQEKGAARIFQPFLRQFFVRGCDPAHVKILKLEILTNLARADNISILLRYGKRL